MGLFSGLSRRPRGQPLHPPSLDYIRLPDLKVLKKHGDEVADFKDATHDLVQNEAARLRDDAVAVVRALLEPLANELGERGLATDDKSMGSYAFMAAVGLAHSQEEERRGWQRPGEVDARTHASLYFPGDKNEARQFFLEAGYWYARTGDEGLKALVGQ